MPGKCRQVAGVDGGVAGAAGAQWRQGACLAYKSTTATSFGFKRFIIQPFLQRQLADVAYE